MTVTNLIKYYGEWNVFWIGRRYARFSDYSYCHLCYAFIHHYYCYYDVNVHTHRFTSICYSFSIYKDNLELLSAVEYCFSHTLFLFFYFLFNQWATYSVSPENPSIFIGECGGKEQCSQPLLTSGSANCSISGFRPPVRLSMEVDDATKDAISLNYISETIIRDESTGTSTTTVMYAYEAPECTDNVTLKCMPVPDKYNLTSIYADLLLEAGNCILLVLGVMLQWSYRLKHLVEK